MHRERGFSITELMVTLVILLMSMAVFYEMIVGSLRSGVFTESRNDLVVFGQRAVNSIEREISQARLILEEDSTGTGYRTLFTAGFPGGTSVWTGSRMPIIDQNTTSLGPDPGPNSITNRTGNSLIVIRQLSPITVAYDHDANAGTADVNFLADRYEFQFYFLRQNTARNFGNFGYYLDPTRAKSQIFADYFQLNSITTNKAQLVTRLRPSIARAWDPGKPAGTAFYNLDAAGTLSSATLSSFTVSLASLIPELAGGRVTGKMEYSIGLNASSMTVRDPIPLFATASSNFPGGLEFQIVGQSGARKVLTRMVLASWYNRQFESRESRVIASSHGF